MAKGGVPNNRADHRFDHLVVAAMEKGYGQELRYQGIETFERADDIRRGIYRCAKHRGITADAGRNVPTEDDNEMGMHKMPDGTWELRYRIWSKAQARKRHLERYGTDRSKWPYDPRRPMTEEEKQKLYVYNELGQRVTH